MKELFIATNNAGKAKDFETLFKPFGVTVLTLNDIDEAIDVEETGDTFEANAILKAETVARLLGKFVIADDSGLEIDALDGAPGVYSARYAGERKSDNANNDKVLEGLVAVPEEGRGARFRCVLAVAGPGMETETFSGSCEGRIHSERKGTNGFGYDPIFYLPDRKCTMAELSAEEKSSISHRGAALANLKKKLPLFLKQLKDSE
ncbi:XTP/dITP diphosphatase [Filibacter tadaridae]|uniref:dITP/XTP pyrophosphatase n=1 Tax=Filibacter tadaridae TaxID=2483811 RepID=A0A3P5XD81_9BACL|nr:XTP/dITP diphosphatase [Filibacter tadaridae]VDC32679.1 Non-canonical purine NTP pyrophosphatase [Filibacter tadaridae]